MIPDSEFALPRSSYEAPVGLVSVDPDATPLVTISVNAAWIPYIVGSLKQLFLQTTWDTTDPAEWEITQKRVALLISLFTEA